MKALVYKGPRDVRVEEVPDAKIEQPTDVLSEGYDHKYLWIRFAHVRGPHGCRKRQSFGT